MHEATEPTFGKINFLLAIIGVALGRDGETGGINPKARLAISAKGLKMMEQIPRVIDVSGAQARVGGFAEAGVAVHGQAAVAGFVGGKAFEENDVVSDGDDGIARH